MAILARLGLAKPLIWLIVLIIFGVGGYYSWLLYDEHSFEKYLQTQLNLETPVEINIKSGTTLRKASEILASGGVISEAPVFARAVVRLGHERDIKAGYYLVETDITYANLIDKLVSGDFLVEKFTIIEGHTFADVLRGLRDHPYIDQQSVQLQADPAWQQIAATDEKSPEGMLYPDTYLFDRGTPDIELLIRAHQRLIKVLNEEWEMRDENTPLSSPYEALILASIIEKETGISDERKLVASVFINRLRRGIRLQSDPTVIYGLGDKFDGNLRKADLQQDTLYNSYTRKGLPPTPIAMPGRAAIHAALNPADSDYFYFVANGQGGHHFSKTLREHNNAVNRYQR